VCEQNLLVPLPSNIFVGIFEQLHKCQSFFSCFMKPGSIFFCPLLFFLSNMNKYGEVTALLESISCFLILQKFYQEGARIEAAFRKYFYRADPEQKTDTTDIIVCHANVIRYFVCRYVCILCEGVCVCVYVCVCVCVCGYVHVWVCACVGV